MTSVTNAPLFELICLPLHVFFGFLIFGFLWSDYFRFLEFDEEFGKSGFKCWAFVHQLLVEGMTVSDFRLQTERNVYFIHLDLNITVLLNLGNTGRRLILVVVGARWAHIGKIS